MKTQWLIVSILLFAMAMPGQNGLKEFRKTIDAYAAIQHMSFDVEVHAYEQKSSRTSQLIGRGFAKKAGSLFYSRFGENEILQQEGKTLMINTDSRRIDFYEYDKSAAKRAQMGLDLGSLLDSLATIKDSSFVYEGIQEGFKRFSRKTPGELIDHTDMYVNPTSNLISRIVYYYSENFEDFDIPFATVIIQYKNTSLATVPPQYFALEKFIRKSGQHYIGATSYQGFKVLVHKPN